MVLSRELFRYSENPHITHNYCHLSTQSQLQTFLFPGKKEAKQAKAAAAAAANSNSRPGSSASNRPLSPIQPAPATPGGTPLPSGVTEKDLTLFSRSQSLAREFLERENSARNAVVDDRTGAAGGSGEGGRCQGKWQGGGEGGEAITTHKTGNAEHGVPSQVRLTKVKESDQRIFSVLFSHKTLNS